jgi:hypothetical protein
MKDQLNHLLRLGRRRYLPEGASSQVFNKVLQEEPKKKTNGWRRL